MSDTLGFFIFVAVVLLWAGCAIWGIRRAVANGDSEGWVALVAFLIGPLAPLIALAKPRGKKCRFCLSTMPEKATVCPKCARAQ